MRDPSLPELIVTAYDTHLYDGQRSQADGYLVKSHLEADELRRKIKELLSL